MENEKNVTWHSTLVTREDRERQNGHKGAILWFTGLSGSGKSTLAHAVEKELYGLGCQTFVFDGDNVRHGLCSDLGFSREDRKENIRRIGEMVKLFLETGIIGLAAFISPYRNDRRMVRNLVSGGDFIEIYCRCSLEVCERRDKKGLYSRARAGEIKEFTGISAPYEEPENADIIVDTDKVPLNECVEKILDLIQEKKIIKSNLPQNKEQGH